MSHHVSCVWVPFPRVTMSRDDGTTSVRFATMADRLEHEPQVDRRVLRRYRRLQAEEERRAAVRRALAEEYRRLGFVARDGVFTETHVVSPWTRWVSVAVAGVFALAYGTWLAWCAEQVRVTEHGV